MKTSQESESNSKFLTFPNGFLWGTSTSHFQIEGNPFEINNRLSDWSSWTEDPSHIADQSTADKACEFYRNFSSDLDFLAQLNLNAFRLSLNWAAICPGPKKINKEMIDYYRQLLQKIKKANCKTFVTLFHFCLPQWLAEKEGWANERTAYEFNKFSELVCNELGDLVDFWTTLNEPLVYTYYGYLNGYWPPGYINQFHQAFIVLRHLLVGHAASYRTIHDIDKSAQVSYTAHWRPFTPRQTLNPLDVLVAHNRDALFNHLFPKSVQTGQLQFSFLFELFNHQPFMHDGLNERLEAHLENLTGPISDLKDSADYLGINYYTREICEFSTQAPFSPLGVKSEYQELPVNAMGWENYPAGLFKLLTVDTLPYQRSSDGDEKPIYITENGYASRFLAHEADGDWSLDDRDRIIYLQDHLYSIYKAIQAGVNVKGYLYWSLLDNFEWAEGLQMRFGLVRVAYPTQTRAPRKSAQIYAQIAQRNGLINSHEQ